MAAGGDFRRIPRRLEGRPLLEDHGPQMDGTPKIITVVCTQTRTPSPYGDVHAVASPLMGSGNIFLRRATENP